jgi:hypothetical protein
MCLAGGAYAANQQCFYGKNCVDGQLVSKQHFGPHMRKHWKFMKHTNKMHKKEACPCKEEGKCAADKEGKTCGFKSKIKKNKEGFAGCNCKEQGKPCAGAHDKHHGCKDKKHHHKAKKAFGKDKK